jgi:hypothetical protein
MRSRIATWLILLTCAGTFPALTSCGSPAANRNDLGDRSQTSSGATANSVARPQATVPVSHLAPATDSLHIDLYCELHGRVVSDPHPELSNGTYPANVRTWRQNRHYIVDLQARLACDAGFCEPVARLRIGVSPEKIVLDDVPGALSYVSRRDWRFHERVVDLQRVSVTTGICRRGRFSGFPQASEESQGHNT